MKILIVVEIHYKEYGGPFTAINQKIEYLNYKNITTKLIFKKTDHFSFSIDLNYIIKDFDIVHIYGNVETFFSSCFLLAKRYNKKIIISPIGTLEPWSLSQKKYKKIAWNLYIKNS